MSEAQASEKDQFSRRHILAGLGAIGAAVALKAVPQIERFSSLFVDQPKIETKEGDIAFEEIKFADEARLTGEVLRYDHDSKYNAIFTDFSEPKPDGTRPVFINMGDSKLERAAGGYKPPHYGLKRWHDGQDPQYHSPDRPSTSDNWRWGGKPMDEWLPKAWAKSLELPINGFLLVPDLILSYGRYLNSSSSTSENFHDQLAKIVEDANLRAVRQNGFALTIMFPTMVWNPYGPESEQVNRTLDLCGTALENMKRRLVPLASSSKFQFEINTDWLEVIEPLVAGQRHEELVELYDDPLNDRLLVHPRANHRGAHIHGNHVVAANERMARFIREVKN